MISTVEIVGSSRSQCAAWAAYWATIDGRRALLDWKPPPPIEDLLGKFDTETTLQADQDFVRHARRSDWLGCDRIAQFGTSTPALRASPAGAQYRANHNRRPRPSADKGDQHGGRPASARGV